MERENLIDKKVKRKFSIGIQNVVLFIVSMIAFVDDFNAQGQVSHFIPEPESVVYSEGVFMLNEETQVAIPEEYFDEIRPYLEEKFLADLGFTPIFSREEGKSKSINFKISQDESILEEGYLLSIKSDQISISARDYGGLFNGFQTLRQTFTFDDTKDVKIPALQISDNPRFSWRGLMLDVSRHFQSKEFILKQIDILSSYKINKFHWHLTDDQGWRIEIKQYPKLTEKGAWRADRTGIPWWKREKASAEEVKTVGGFYTHEDIKEVIAYAKIRNVEVIPEIDVPGHSKALVASYPTLFCHEEPNANFEVAVGGKAPDNAVCAGKETSYQFLENVINEVAGLFPSKYLHIGGDECNKTNWKKCSFCQKVKLDNNLKDEEELQSYFIQRMQKMVEKAGKTMIGWDEILSGNGAEGATIMAWRRGKYQPQITAPQSAYPTIMTSYLYSYISQVQGPKSTEPEGPNVVLPLSKVYGHEPVDEALTSEEVKFVLGNQASLWGEFTPSEEHCEYMLYPRVLASAEVSWSDSSVKDWTRFQAALESYHFEFLERQKANVSKSLFSIYASYALDELRSEAIVFLNTETVGHQIYYTLDGSDPSPESIKYKDEFRTAHKTLLKAGLFNNEGELLGKIVELRLK